MITYTVQYAEAGRWKTALTTRSADRASKSKRRIARLGNLVRIIRTEAMKVAA